MTQSDEMYKIGGGFAFLNAPFASHPNDDRRARETIVAMLADGLDRDRISILFRACIEKQDRQPDAREWQTARVKERLDEWLN